jgi:hypothetical protein
VQCSAVRQKHLRPAEGIWVADLAVCLHMSDVQSRPARSSHDSRVGFLDYLVDHDRDPSTTHATCNVGQARASACVVPSLESLSSLFSACRVASRAQ